MSTKLEQSNQTALLAISGGLDSIVLFHLLSGEINQSRKISSANTKRTSQLITLIKDFLKTHPITKLELAYIDHSQREDTDLDIKAIRTVIKSSNAQLHIIKLDLPQGCSEEVARKARYQALTNLQEDRGLKHLITAHHADDVLETAIINLTRGTGPRGLCSLQHQEDGIWRPYLSQFENEIFITKKDLLDYAKANNLVWHEDSTNLSSKYLRNRIRHQLESANSGDKQQFLKLITSTLKITKSIDQEVLNLENELRIGDSNSYSAKLFKSLPEEVQHQFLHTVLSKTGYDIDRASVLKAGEFIQTKATGKVLQLKGCDVVIPKKGVFSVAPARQKVL